MPFCSVPSVSGSICTPSAPAAVHSSTILAPVPPASGCVAPMSVTISVEVVVPLPPLVSILSVLLCLHPLVASEGDGVLLWKAIHYANGILSDTVAFQEGSH